MVLSGVSGSGKTTCYKSLAGAYHHIRELRALGKQSQSSSKRAAQHKIIASNNFDPANDYPCIDITVINPAIYTNEQVCLQRHLCIL